MLSRHLLLPFLATVSCGIVLTLWACAPAQPTRVLLNGAVLEPARALPPLTFRRTDSGTFTSPDFPGVVGLIGSDAELARARAAFGVIAERHDLADGDYVLDHTAAIYMVNSAGQIQLAYPYGTPPSDILADVQRLAAAAHGSSPAANT